MKSSMCFPIVAAIFLLGCSTTPVNWQMVHTSPLQETNQVGLIDSKALPENVAVDRRADGNLSIEYQPHALIPSEGADRVGYTSLAKYGQALIAVETRLNGKKSYPMIVDTGAGVPFYFSGRQVRECGLEVQPRNLEDGQWSDSGYCYAEKLSIGETDFEGVLGFYEEKVLRMEVFGIRGTEAKIGLIGLPVLRSMKYVVFDGRTDELEWSPAVSFKPDEKGEWESYPFEIRSTSGNPVLLVHLPIAGNEMTVQMDTGSAGGLAIRDSVWNEIRSSFGEVKLREGESYYPFMVGLVESRKGKAHQVQVGHRTLTELRLSILQADSVVADQGEGLLGMQPFKDTVLAFDFENNRMWVRYEDERRGLFGGFL